LILLTRSNPENMPHDLFSALYILTTILLFISVWLAEKNKDWVSFVVPIAVVSSIAGLFFTILAQRYLENPTWSVATILLAGSHAWGTTGLPPQNGEMIK